MIFMIEGLFVKYPKTFISIPLPQFYRVYQSFHIERALLNKRKAQQTTGETSGVFAGIYWKGVDLTLISIFIFSRSVVVPFEV